VLLGAFLLLPLVGRSGQLTEVRLAAPPQEVSGLLAVQDGRLLAARGWDVGFWAVGDEKRVERNLALIGWSKATGAWAAEPVKARIVTEDDGSDDSEDLCRKDGYVYIIGSHFGSKTGPLNRKRQFLARFRESEWGVDPARPTLKLELVEDRFRLHRLINDALRNSAVPLITRTDKETRAYISAAQKEYADKDWAKRIEDGDWPLNIEGAVFLPSGSLLLGLRYPVAADGSPVLVEVANIEALFGGDGRPSVKRIWILSAPDAGKHTTGIRALARRGDTVHAIVGSIDSTNKDGESVILDGRPGSAGVLCTHYTFSFADVDGHKVAGRLVRRFGVGDVEGLDFDTTGTPVFVRDRRGGCTVLFE
jgi:hypothetical protein